VTLTATITKGAASDTQIFSLTIPLAIPSAPTGLTVGNPTANSLPVSWNTTPEAESYQVRRNDGTLRYSGVGTSFTDDFDQTAGLASGTTYSYSVQATNTSGSSLFSAAVSGTTLKLVPPNLAVGSPSASSLTVSWTGVKGATSYQVSRDTSPTGLFSTSAYNGTLTTFIDTGLSAITLYYYKIQATYPAGAGDLSAAASGTTAAVGSVATPTFSPVAGSYSSRQTVAISSSNTFNPVSIRYTTDGRTPTAAVGTVYSSAITVSSNTTINAIAYKTGYTDSSVVSATYTILPPVATPTFGLAGGNYVGSQTTTISCATSGASIRITTNGTNPTSTTGTLFTNGGIFSIGSTMQIRAIAYMTGYSNSTIAAGNYNLQLAAPVFTLAAGAYTSSQVVTINAMSGTSIRYTIDGTTPSATVGTLTSPGLAMSIDSSMTLKAMAYITSGWTDSSVTTATYSIPVAYFPFNSNTLDMKGGSLPSNNGAPTGGPTYTSGRKSGETAISLNGSSQYVTLPNETSFNFSTFTIYAIVKVNTPSKSNTIVTKPSTSGKASYTQDNATGGNWSHFISASAITAGTYVHIAMTFAGTTAVNYINGAQTSSQPSVPAPVQNNNPVIIGALPSGGASFYFAGAIDEVIIYNKALTASEISQLYTALQ
jgi:hypothetical protein